MSSCGVTALMSAAASGKATTVVRAVLDLGAKNLEVRSKIGDTAFLVACAKGSAECIGMLAEAGCDSARSSQLPRVAPEGGHFGKLPDLRASPRAVDHPVELDHLLTGLQRTDEIGSHPASAAVRLQRTDEIGSHPASAAIQWQPSSNVYRAVPDSLS